MIFKLIDSMSIFSAYVVIAILMLVSFEIGYQIGGRARKRQEKDTADSLGPMVGGLLGMLAFVLAFTFSIAASNHNLRKQNVLDEANVVGTAYLRADLIDDQQRSEVKRLLREYVDLRLQAVGVDSIEKLKKAIARSVEIHKLLWTQVSIAAKAEPNSNTALLVKSVNDIIDMHEKRVTAGLYNKIPLSIWIALLAISTLTMMTMGTQVGHTGKRKLVAVIPVSLAFAVLVTVILDLDRPQRGLITVEQRSMIDLKATFDQGKK